jgi:hypothetical protein
VGLERTHAEFLGQGEGLLVVGCSLCSLRGLPPRRNVAEEAEGRRLAIPFLVLTGKGQRTLNKRARLLEVAGAHLRFT